MSDPVPVIAVAVDAASVERPVIDAWAREQDPPVAAVLDAVTGTGEGLGAALASYDEALLVPVRVAWLPTRRAAGRHVPAVGARPPRDAEAPGDVALPPADRALPRPSPRAGRRARHAQQPAQAVPRHDGRQWRRRGRRRGPGSVRTPFRRGHPGARGAGRDRQPLQGAARRQRGDPGPQGVPRRGGPGLGGDGAHRRRRDRPGRGVPRRAGRRPEPRRRRHVLRDDVAAARLHLAGTGRRDRAEQAARAQQAPRAGVPADPPLLRRPAAAGRRARRQRLPAQPRARRRQPALLAGRRPGQAGRRGVHPAQLRRRRDLQGRGAGVLRLPAVQAVQPRVVHGGRPLAHRQAPPARATACCATSPRPC